MNEYKKPNEYIFFIADWIIGSFKVKGNSESNVSKEKLIYI